MNRLIEPDFQTITEINKIDFKLQQLKNGIKVYVLNRSEQDILKIDFVFDAGTKYQEKSLVASFCNSLSQEGSQQYGSEEISEKLDFLGSYWQRFIDRDFAGFSLFSLGKFVKESIDLAAEICMHPVFPVEELETFRKRQKQQFVTDGMKVTTLSRNKFNQVVFGEDHIYGKVAALEDYDKVNQEDLLAFHAKHYGSKSLKIIVSGKVTDEALSYLNLKFGMIDWGGEAAVVNALEPKGLEQKQHFVQKDEALQASIRIGKVIINKDHPDYSLLQVCNTILGGYFGSRLIKNLREDKGYTYGIFSVLHPLKHSGLFAIISEVGGEIYPDALKEIYKEIRLLQESPVDEEELNLVKNYMMGELMRGMDGAFAQSEILRSLIDFDLDPQYISNHIKEVLNASPLRIQEIAQTYLGLDSFYEVVAGNKGE